MSYNVSDAYFTAQINAESPLILAVLETALGYHVFLDSPCAAANLPTATPYHLGARLIRLSGLTETLIPDVSTLFANYTQTEMPECSLTLQNNDDYFAPFLAVQGFLDATLTLVQGYPSTAYADMLTLFSGVVSQERLTDDGLELVGVRT